MVVFVKSEKKFRLISLLGHAYSMTIPGAQSIQQITHLIAIY